MRILAPIIFSFFFFSCQKEVSVDTNQTVASTFDSLVGRWRYLYDYRLETTKADSTVVLDTYYGGRYDPFSYLEIKADSSFKWWRSESRSLPMYGGGEAGHIIPDQLSRSMKWRSEFHSMDNFVTQIPYTTPLSGTNFRIKYLDSDSMVLYFRSGSANPDNYWWWHDVYVK
ncbi:MAG: hypothetical protein JNM14_03020 [Ferruginibacter sp.]|nr:hypothetical protein [Ferruginibacter sp.]